MKLSHHKFPHLVQNHENIWTWNIWCKSNLIIVVNGIFIIIIHMSVWLCFDGRPRYWKAQAWTTYEPSPWPRWSTRMPSWLPYSRAVSAPTSGRLTMMAATPGRSKYYEMGLRIPAIWLAKKRGNFLYWPTVCAVNGMYAYNARTRTAMHPVTFPCISKMHSHTSSNCSVYQ